ncbi:type II toxin-antitoxin system PemK/MazF family toxin [Salmonella enterica]|nr:type II toxin-antitoxin system PemK/MazF family toxin [Salmonella enterica]
MNQGDIYICDLEPIAGHEQGGKRPVLVVSSTAFNKVAGTPVILPITTGGKFADRIGFALPVPAGHKTKGTIRCDQPRTLDIAARHGYFAERLADDALSEAIERMFAIFE